MEILSPQIVDERVKSNLLAVIDVREPYECDICSIPAMKIPMAEIPTRIAELPTDKALVIMCKTGKRAEAVAHFIAVETKRSDIHILEGGIMNWIEQINPDLEVY